MFYILIILNIYIGHKFVTGLKYICNLERGKLLACQSTSKREDTGSEICNHMYTNLGFMFCG